MKKPISDHKTASYTFLIIIFVSLVYGVFVSVLQENTTVDINDFWIMALLNLGLYVLYFGVFILVCKQCRITGPALFQELNISKKVNIKDLCSMALLAGLCLAGFMLISNAFDELLQALGYIKESSISIDSFEKYFTMVVILALLPAVIEELLFRGIILKGLLQFGKIPAIISSAVLFSLYHLSPAQTLYQFIMGIVMAIIVLRTGKLVYAMVFHFINNFSILTIEYIAGDIGLLFSWTAVSIALTVGLALFSLFFIYQLLKRLNSTTQVAMPKERQRFFYFDNIGFYICVALAGLVWLVNFVGA